MLTWAMVYLAVKKVMAPANYIPFIVAMGFDVAIFFYISEAFRHAR